MSNVLADRDRWLPTRKGRLWCASWSASTKSSSERNFASACICLTCAIVIAAALTNDRWIRLSGGHCSRSHLGPPLFCETATFSRIHDVATGQQHIIYHYRGFDVIDCVSPSIANAFYGLIGLCFVIIFTSLAAAIIAIFATSDGGFFKWLRSNAVLEVCNVILCVITMSVALIAVSMVDQLQHDTTWKHARNSIRVSVDQGFYFIVSAGLLSLVAIIISVYRALSQRREHHRQNRRLISAHALRSTLSRQHHHHNRAFSMHSTSSTELLVSPLTFYENYLDATTSSGT